MLNGRPFINNVSLGVYAQMVGDPGYRQDKLGVAKTKLQAALSEPELRRALRITPPDGAPLESVVAMVVSNNPYEFARWDRLGQRQRLDAGTLQVSVLDASTLDGLERLLAGTLLGAIEFRPALRHWMSERVEIGVLGEMVRAGVDGEPITFEAPLRFAVDPGALRLLVPDGPPASRQVPPLEAGWQAARALRRWLRPPPAMQKGGSDDTLIPTDQNIEEHGGPEKPTRERTLERTTRKSRRDHAHRPGRGPAPSLKVPRIQQHRHEVQPYIVEQPGLQVLPGYVRAPEHDGPLARGHLGPREGAFDALVDEGERGLTPGHRPRPSCARTNTGSGRTVSSGPVHTARSFRIEVVVPLPAAARARTGSSDGTVTPLPGAESAS